ncbi:MAG: UDP-2,3-diacylglucosamine diphosphatase, partial [Bacteroidales bacterium]|nr:UDP-2,3-diacylglucosamine diphosphatase [Bacteroidales bacterium]
MNTINGKVYFISDAHLGVPDFSSSLEREKKLVKWLCQIEKDADYLILLGDIFDFWFEYKSVIPRGYTRLMGKLAELSDKGIQIYFFTGNHDMWVRDYFKKELGIKVLNKPETFLINGLK